MAEITQPQAVAQMKRMVYSQRVLAVTVLRLEMMSAVYGQPIGHLIDRMVARNFRHISENGKLADFMDMLETDEEVDET